MLFIIVFDAVSIIETLALPELIQLVTYAYRPFGVIAIFCGKHGTLIAATMEFVEVFII